MNEKPQCCGKSWNRDAIREAEAAALEAVKWFDLEYAQQVGALTLCKAMRDKCQAVLAMLPKES